MMLTFKHRRKSIKTIFLYLLLILMSWSLISCSQSLESKEIGDRNLLENKTQPSNLSEVASPAVINQLDSLLSKYQPQVSILTPEPDQLLTQNTVTVKVGVKDLPIFQDSQFNLGPHLELIVDNNRYLSIYDLNEPIILEDLAPGTHTLRVFAVKPWSESFKNEGAYAQTTFHVYTQTDNTPDPSLPLLTYNSPQGVYGAEPIMLDFYLTNAPLHFVAKQNSEDDISDWRIKVTINDESFLLDTWKGVYLTGFKPGINWVKLEFIDDQGEKIKNLFNTSVKLLNYKPEGQDNLSKLIRGELSLDSVQSIIDPNYIPPSIPTTQTLPEVEIDSPETQTLPEVEIDSPETQTIPEVEIDSPVIETIPEVEVDSPVIETIPEVEIDSPETQTLPEIEIDSPETQTFPEIEIDSPVIETIPEVEIDTPVIETPPEVEIDTPLTEAIPLKFDQEIRIEEWKNSQLPQKMTKQSEELVN